MKKRRRFDFPAVLAGAAILLALSGCAENGTLIVGDVSFRNDPARTFPPAGHSGDLTNDVCYVRLVDDDGAGAVLWESIAYDASFLQNYISPTPTPNDGVHIEQFLIPLSSADLAAAAMPLRLEAYLYDAAVAVPPINPAVDADDYSYEGTDMGGQWFYSFALAEGSIVTIPLVLTVPIP